MLIERGTSRDGQQAANDTIVRFETTQEKRWAHVRRTTQVTCWW